MSTGRSPEPGRGARSNSRPPAELGPDLLGEFGREGVPRYLLMPGDPDRVSLIASHWKSSRIFDLPRGFRAAAGDHNGVRMGALASGMGAPSLEFILTEAVQAGADTIIRVGTAGSLRADIQNGELIVNEAAVRMDGATHHYVRLEYPAAASYEVTLALIDACEGLAATYHVGVAATTSSFFLGQGRANPAGYEPEDSDRILREMQQAHVLNFEMEGAALFVLARLLGVRAGMVAAVIANRVTGEWDERGGIQRACLVASEAASLLADWDEAKLRDGKEYFSPRLAKRSGRNERGEEANRA